MDNQQDVDQVTKTKIDYNTVRKAENDFLALLQNKKDYYALGRIYDAAVTKMNSNDLAAVNEAKALFEQISDRMDVQIELENCDERIRVIQGKDPEVMKKTMNKFKVAIFAVLAVGLLLFAAKMILNYMDKSSVTNQLIESTWCSFDSDGSLDSMIEFKDKENAAINSSYDSLNEKWEYSADYTWEYYIFRKEKPILKLGEDKYINVVRTEDGTIQNLEYDYVTYAPFSEEEYKDMSSKLAAGELENQYQYVLSRLSERQNDGLLDIVNTLGDYQECTAIKAELEQYEQIMTELGATAKTFGGRDKFAPAIEFMDSAKYVKFPETVEHFLKVAAPFVGNWKFSDGDVKIISYGGKDSAKFHDVNTVEVEGAIDTGTGQGQIHMSYNGGSTGTYIDLADMDKQSASFEITRYVGGDFKYSVKKDKLHVDFDGESDMPVSGHVTAEYSRAD